MAGSGRTRTLLVLREGSLERAPVRFSLELGQPVARARALTVRRDGVSRVGGARPQGSKKQPEFYWRTSTGRMKGDDC